ncbi:MAG: beta-N-acetylhexosaminidase [Candidatus Berkiellales bacterium]
MPYGPLIVSVNGYHVSKDQEEARILQNAYVGGVILFSKNYQNVEQLKQLTSEIKDIAKDANKDLMIMVDHEGGYVQRFRSGFSATPAAKVLGDIYDINPDTALKYANQLGKTVSRELKDVGVDIVLGPVVDLDAGNEVISGLDRAYHSDPRVVSEIATAYVKGLETNGLHATLKHFPGHGSVSGDSHLVEPTDNRPLEEIKLHDLIPFQNLIAENIIDAVMPAHVKYPIIDSANTAGTSKIWLEDILRSEMNFDGVIISDCLSMTGAGSDSNLEKTKKALEFGDLALLSNQTPHDYLQVLDTLQEQHFTWSVKSQHRVEAWLGMNQPENILQAIPASEIVA